jgi:hypothetical protein
MYGEMDMATARYKHLQGNRGENMKAWLRICLVVWLGAQSNAWAQGTTTPTRLPRGAAQEVIIPKSVERIKDYEKIKGEAAAKKKCVVIVISEEGTKKPYLWKYTQFALERGNSLGVLIYVDIKEVSHLPKQVTEQANGLRGAVPGILLINPESEEVIATVPHKKDQMEWEKDIREAKKKLSGEAPGKPNQKQSQQ